MFSSLNPSKCTHTWSSGHGARGAVGGSQGGVVAGWCSRTIQENETEVGILVNHNLTWADVGVMRQPENKKEPTGCLEWTVHIYKYGNAVQNNKRHSRGHKGRTKTS